MDPKQKCDQVPANGKEAGPKTKMTRAFTFVVNKIHSINYPNYISPVVNRIKIMKKYVSY